MLVEASCWEASEMESGFLSWCKRHVPTWRKRGYDETWIRQRIETAQITRGLHRELKQKGLTHLPNSKKHELLYRLPTFHLFAVFPACFPGTLCLLSSVPQLHPFYLKQNSVRGCAAPQPLQHTASSGRIERMRHFHFYRVVFG